MFAANWRNHSCYRVPTVVTTNNGTIIIMVESRRTSCDDQSPKDIEMSRSHDGGRSWELPTVVFGDLTGDTTFRNPYLTVVANKAGQEGIVLQFVNSTVAEPWTTLQMTSTDVGNTWTDARAVRMRAYYTCSYYPLAWQMTAVVRLTSGAGMEP